MSLILNSDTNPPVKMKTFGIGEDKVFIGDLEIGIGDFVLACQYVLTNTDLKVGDPRLSLVEAVKASRVVQGYNGGASKRIEMPIPRS